MPPLLEVKNLKKYFPLKKSTFSRFFGASGEVIRAVDGVSFALKQGETLGLIGESGCGKTTLARTIMRLHEPTEGEIQYKGESINGADEAVIKKLRHEVQMIFQDALFSLNPRMSVFKCLEEPLILRGVKDKEKRKKTIKEALERVSLQNHFASRYPAELSGGQRQRVCLARALLLNPRFIIL